MRRAIINVLRNRAHGEDTFPSITGAPPRRIAHASREGDLDNIALFPLYFPVVLFVGRRASVGVANIATGRHTIGQTVGTRWRIVSTGHGQMKQREAEEKHDGDSTGHVLMGIRLSSERLRLSRGFSLIAAFLGIGEGNFRGRCAETRSRSQEGDLKHPLAVEHQGLGHFSKHQFQHETRSRCEGWAAQNAPQYLGVLLLRDRFGRCEIAAPSQDSFIIR